MRTIVKCAKLFLLFFALGMFIAAEYIPGEEIPPVKVETIQKSKLPVMISCFGCSYGSGMLIAHNPNDRNLAYYADEAFEIRWYNTSGKLYAVNTFHIWYVCGESFTVEVRNKKTGERGVAGFAAVPCRPVELGQETLNRKSLE